MNDRLRGAMERLNSVNPDDAVYERAKQGPRLDSPERDPSRSKRVVAGMIAFAVFAPAAVFAWQANHTARRPALHVTGPAVTATPAPGLERNGLDVVLHAPGLITAIAGSESEGYVYVSAAKEEGDQTSARTIVRWNESGGQMLESEPLPGGGLVVAGGSLWASGGSPRNDLIPNLPQAPYLFHLDPVTLKVTAQVQTGTPPAAIVASPDGMLWVGAGNRVLEVDPVSGALVRSVSVRGRVQLLSVDPSGSRLYVSSDALVAPDANLLMELDTATGRVLASSAAGVHELLGPTALTATIAGVWTTYPTGAAAAVVFEPEGLSRMRPAFVRNSSAARTSLAGGALWVSDGSNFSCVDPTSGRVRAKIPLVGHASVSGPVAEAAGGLYIAAFDWLVHIVLPPTACGVPPSLLGHG